MSDQQLYSDEEIVVPPRVCVECGSPAENGTFVDMCDGCSDDICSDCWSVVGDDSEDEDDTPFVTVLCAKCFLRMRKKEEDHVERPVQ